MLSRRSSSALQAVCIAQSALVIFEGASGLGKHARDLDTNQIDFILKVSALALYDDSLHKGANQSGPLNVLSGSICFRRTLHHHTPVSQDIRHSNPVADDPKGTPPSSHCDRGTHWPLGIGLNCHVSIPMQHPAAMGLHRWPMFQPSTCHS
jgi:hypothetical protein